jgi:DNA helicase HerA-like ATPase
MRYYNKLKTALWESVLQEHGDTASSLPVTLTRWTKVHLEQPTVTQLLKKTTQKFMNITTKSRQWFLSWVTLIQYTASHPKSHFNIILSSIARTLKWYNLFRFSHQKNLRAFLNFTHSFP